MSRRLVYTACVVVGLPFAGAGILLCLTIIGAVIGIPLILLSGVPLALANMYYVKKDLPTETATRKVRKEELEVIDWSDEEYDFYGNPL